MTCERRYSWQHGPVKVCGRPAVGVYRVGQVIMNLCRRCAVETVGYRIKDDEQDVTEFDRWTLNQEMSRGLEQDSRGGYSSAARAASSLTRRRTKP